MKNIRYYAAYNPSANCAAPVPSFPLGEPTDTLQAKHESVLVGSTTFAESGVAPFLRLSGNPVLLKERHGEKRRN